MSTQKQIWMLFCFSLITSLLLINMSYSEEIQNPGLLFEYDRVYTGSAVPESYELERNYITLKRDISPTQYAEGDIITIELNGSMQEFSILRATSYVDGTYSISARGGESGRDQLLVTFEEDKMVGSIVTIRDPGLYYIRYDRERAQIYISSIDQEKLDYPECRLQDGEVHTHFQLPPATEATHKYPGRAHHSPNMSALASTLTDMVTIDLMIVYTESAENWANNSGFGSIQALIAESMNLSQNALDNSNVYIYLRLVHTHKTDYDETEIDPEDGGVIHLKRFTASPNFNPFGEEYDGYMDEVHALRNEYGADLLALFANQTGTGGRGWLLTSPFGLPHYGFTLDDIRWVGSHYILIHEIGHNMGNAHSRDQNSFPAGPRGGIFEYSTGRRWAGSTRNYTTVMGYEEETHTRIPYFSNPDIMWEGEPTGAYFVQHGPSDNARSMRETKAVIANYRPTMVDPPSISVSENSIEISMDRETTYDVPVTITNTGDSDLVWSVDFEPKFPIIAKENVLPGKSVTGEKPPKVERTLDIDGLIGGGAIFTTADAENNVLLSTGFESDEGFNTGTYNAARLWRTWTDSQNFEISDENPANGNNHLRIHHHAHTDFRVSVISPFFGPQPFGAFEFSLDLSFENMVSGDQYERFDIYFYDMNSGTTARVVFFNGWIWVLNLNEDGEEIFTNSGQGYSIENYENLRVVLNPDEGTVDYYYGDHFLMSTVYISGKKIDYFQFFHWNNVSGTYIDIDNVQVKRNYDPFQWLNINRYGGVATAGGSSELLFEFSTVDIEAGEYASDMIVRSNDPDIPAIVIPLKLHVSDIVTVDDKPDIAREFALLQNYPNPFNPATTITFRVPEAGQVRLEVYDIVGRRISILLDDEVEAGEHQVTFDVAGLSSGIYIYRMISSAGTLNKKMVVTK